MPGRSVYTYVGNDPLDKTDPTGNVAGVDDAAEVGAVLIAAGALYIAAETCTAGSACEQGANAGLNWIGDKLHDVVAWAKEHTKGARPSTKDDHEKGQSRRARDRGGEKGDDKRDPPRKRPDDWKGPWPPKPDPKPDPKPPTPKPDPTPQPGQTPTPPPEPPPPDPPPKA